MNDPVEKNPHNDPEGFKFLAAEYPTEPGVYLMKDDSGRIIYVGKAKNLRKRLSSYFHKHTGHTPKTKALVARIRAIDLLCTGTEKEALLLEASLIKKHRPRYNVVLRDDKQYVLFKLDKLSEFPRLTITRKAKRDGSIYFGPFTSAGAAKATWKLLGKVFPLRKCSDHMFRNRVRPCLYHHIHQCWAPCVLDVSREDYMEQVHRVEMFLSGRTGELLSMLEARMQEAAASMAYEQAAQYRDQVRAIRKTVERQVVVLPGGRDLDVAATAVAENGLGLGLLFIRQGRLLDQKHFFWPGLSLEDGPEVVSSFLAQFYASGKLVPPRIIEPHAAAGEALTEVLADLRQGSLRIGPPDTMQEKELLELARKVARKAGEKQETITARLRSALHLPSEPRRIECVDASHLGGQGMRVGMVVFEDGDYCREAYRTYAFPELEGTGDDYAALSGWARRRVESGPPWPDLVLIDGGRGQLAAVERALTETGIEPWPLASIAKGPTRRAGELEDQIFLPGRRNPLPLKAGSPELLFLQKVRDEAHRHVIGRQRQSRKKVLTSEVESLPGIGPKTARLLWDRFGSLDAMTKAGIEDVQSLPGVGRKRARTILDALGKLEK
ncbi:excinuclease ABC subunit UvrC [Pseudodesulfovibrio tunisiensis]|uniref:excinuclease ABC subunit UvrC n=1 Tax=Pseudodesulfovibrio tunisiensis TaxID=463192 RepID=UPI002436443C|nr:excinuclease ABC subunit UvrC [Pseudodesulfovibrio tunisiensis]